MTKIQPDRRSQVLVELSTISNGSTRERKSVGQETTFERDITNREEMLAVLEQLAEQVAQRLVELGIASRTITLKVRWHDFRLVTRSKSVAPPIQDAPTMMRQP